LPGKKHSLSVLKNARKSLRRRDVNRARKLQLKTTLKQFKGLKTKAEASAKLPDTQAVIDKAARKGLLHPNKVARLKSKLARSTSKLA
jgi:small subunit ribosomal protein S20